MKTKTTILLLSLILSFGFFAQRSAAVSPSGLPPVPSYWNPSFSDITTPPSASADDSQDGMNLNFIGATTPQEPDTFAPLTETLNDVDARDHRFDKPVIITKKSAIENSTTENVITVPQDGQYTCIEIDLGKTLIQCSYDAKVGDYIWNNPWSFQQDNNNIKTFEGSWIGNGGARFLGFSKKPTICQKLDVMYAFAFSSPGPVTLTFTRQDQLHEKPETLTFRLNIVEASAAATAPASSGDGDTSSEK